LATGSKTDQYQTKKIITTVPLWAMDAG